MSKTKPKFDVTFQCGADKSVLEAHKMILAFHSEVFDKMFFGEFPSDGEIWIEDIEKDIFKEVLNSVYGNVVNLTASTVYQVLSTADKYDLKNLQQQCSEYLTSNVDENDLWEVFSACVSINRVAVEKRCLPAILDDPIKFLMQPSFLEISEAALTMLVKQRRINCSTADLKSALLRWLQHNGFHEEEDFGEETYKIIEKQLKLTKSDIYQFRDYYNFKVKDELVEYSELQNSREQLIIDNVYIHGIRILVGISSEHYTNGQTELITVIFEGRKNVSFVTFRYESLKSFSKELLVSRTKPQIIDIFCEKFKFKKNRFGSYDSFYTNVVFDGKKIRANINGRVVAALIYTDFEENKIN